MNQAKAKETNKAWRDTPAVWIKYECGGGSRWLGTTHPAFRYDPTGECIFSGCNCGTTYREVGETSDVNEPWFRRREQAGGAL